MVCVYLTRVGNDGRPTKLRRHLRCLTPTSGRNQISAIRTTADWKHASNTQTAEKQAIYSCWTCIASNLGRCTLWWHHCWSGTPFEHKETVILHIILQNTADKANMAGVRWSISTQQKFFNSRFTIFYNILSILQLNVGHDYTCSNKFLRKSANINLKKLGSNWYVVLRTSTEWHIKSKIWIPCQVHGCLILLLSFSLFQNEHDSKSSCANTWLLFNSNFIANFQHITASTVLHQDVYVLRLP